MGEQAFRNILQIGLDQWGFTLDEEQLEQCVAWARLVREGNEELNLTAITDWEEMAVKHFLDSLAVAPLIQGLSPVTLLDVGTGAGFPGVPLKIWRPELEVTLLDSVGKKTEFLQGAITKLGLKGIQVHWGRAEELGQREDCRDNFDLVVARAVASLPVLLEYCLPLVKVGGAFIALKGPEAQEEVVAAQRALEILGGEIREIKGVQLPFGGGGRTLIFVGKMKPTPPNYPRRPGAPRKRPL
ncbi:MAG: 16S rRNA (guanine(527)-N(7))-methyltransferase RsmG [Limnochordia bacterium]